MSPNYVENVKDTLKTSEIPYLLEKNNNNNSHYNQYNKMKLLRK